jgi:hypothetical protein
MTMERQHGRASYNKGCRCASCREAVKLARRRHRARYRELASAELPYPCRACPLHFASPLGAKVHESHIHDLY